MKSKKKKNLYQKQIKSISKTINKQSIKKKKKILSKSNFRNIIENNLSDYKSNKEYYNEHNNEYNNEHNHKHNNEFNKNLSSVLSTKANGVVFQSHGANCYIGTATALLKSIEKDRAINIAKYLQLREDQQGIIGMHQNELLKVIEDNGKINNPRFDNYTEITNYKELRKYVRAHHKNTLGGFYSICNHKGAISHGVLMGFDESGQFLLIDRQNNFITKEHGYFFYEEDIYNIYWNSYNNNAPIMITTIKFGDITKKLEELDFKTAMNIDNVN